MKKSKLIRQVAVALAIVFMSAVLCGAGCSNVASDSGGGKSPNSGDFMTEAEAIAAINALPSSGSITIKLGSSVKTISTGLQNALKDANKKVVLDLSESGVDISVTGYGNRSMFNSCLSLVEVKLPKAATKIGSYLLYNCTSLTSVEIPSSVTSISSGAFDGCGELRTIKYIGSKSDWNAKIAPNEHPWRNGVPALGVTCSDGKTYKFKNYSVELSDTVM